MGVVNEARITRVLPKALFQMGCTPINNIQMFQISISLGFCVSSCSNKVNSNVYLLSQLGK